MLLKLELVCLLIIELFLAAVIARRRRLAACTFGDHFPRLFCSPCISGFRCQVTKSVISLLNYYRWSKFSIIYEEMWQTVAQSLEQQAKQRNMTVNQMKSAADRHKCCENKMQCCQSGYWYKFIQDTKNRTRSRHPNGTRHGNSLIDLFSLQFTYFWARNRRCRTLCK